MTIKQKIVGNSLGSALLVAVVSLLSAAGMFRIGSLLHTIDVTALRETEDADELEQAAAKIDAVMDEYRTARQSPSKIKVVRMKLEVDAAFDQIAEATARLDQSVRLQAGDGALSSRENGNVRDPLHQLGLMEEHARVLRDDWAKVRSSIDSDSGAKADAALLDRLTLASGALVRESYDFEQGAKDDIMHGIQIVRDRLNTSVRILITAAVFAIILSIGFGLLVGVQLAARLAQLRDGAAEVGKGNLEAHIDILSGDEIGELATAFNEMAAGLRHSRDDARENELKFRELADAIQEVFWVTDPNCSTLHYVSPAYEEIWGRTCESAYQDARSFAEAIVPKERPRVLAALEKAATDGMDEEYSILRPDGTTRRIHARGFPVRDDSGQVQRLVGIAADVTKQKMAEDALRGAHEELEHRVESRTAELQQANEALQESEQRFRQLAENTSAVFWMVSVAGDRMLYVSPRYEQVWGRTCRELYDNPHSWMDAIEPEDRGSAHDAWTALVAGGDFEVEYRIRRPDGTVRWIRDRALPVRDGHGKIYRIAGIAEDITARRIGDQQLKEAKEAAETANRTKSEFLANMSHEIRTPLNGVIGMTDLLLGTTLNAKQLRYAQLIKTSGVSLAELINDILDFSKIEARKLELESVDFDLYLAVEDVTEMMSLKVAQKGVDLACLTMPDVPRFVKGDSGRVKQILVNLVNNAIKFTESGSITTRLTLEEQSQEHLTVRISITDTGIGVPADRMGRLFKSFSQVDASTTRTHGGTGLGLAISKQLAELMGGSIGVESTVGSGSTFWFTVRLGLATQIQTPLPIPAIDARGLHVLAVHQSVTIRAVLCSQLGGWGSQCETAATGQGALEMLVDAAAAGVPYDVAILDGELPDMDTLEMGKAIKSCSNLAATVLLVLLPVGIELEPLHLEAAGFSGHLIKPVRQSGLYDSIVNAIARTSSPAQAVATTLPMTKSVPNDPVTVTQRARILIAEDNRVNQIVASEVLAKHGYGCDIVDNGWKAVAATSTGSYDLVLMDCSMPEMDGFDATRQIRQAEQADPAQPLRHVPIIALTANAINGDRERCLEAGMDDYVSKPIDPDRLIGAIQMLLVKSGPALPMPTQIDATTTPSTAACDETLPLSIDALFDRCMGNSQTVLLILEEFEQQAVADLVKIKQYVGSGDCKGMERVAHALKGASGILSAVSLSDIAFKLERVGRAGVLGDEDQLLTQLDDEIRRCIDYLPTVRAAITKMTEV